MQPLDLPLRLRALVALVSGAALAAAFAPFGVWPLAVVLPALLMLLWDGLAPRAAAWVGFWFSAGTFSVGTYWLYVSIHGFGQAPLWLALLLMLALIAIMSLYYAALGFVIGRWLPATGPVRWLIGIPGAWLVVEWLRGWLLSGFSWLSLGLSQTDSPLAGYAPITGMYGLTLLLLVSAGALVSLLRGAGRARIAAALILLAIWSGGALLRPIEWTTPVGGAVGVAVVQGAIPQDQKWLDANRDTTLELYRSLSLQALGTPLIVWPEAAAPDLANNLSRYLGELYSAASARGSALLLGVVRADDDGANYYNSVLALGATISWYNKHHLVPFAEFFPVPGFVRSWLRMMSLPYSDFTRGAHRQPPLDIAGLRLAATICYEDAYASSQLAALAQATALVNVTNDAWFGRSSARYQHLQISRMRALESRRFLIRAANDGVSAVIDPHGRVIARAAEYRPAVLRAAIVPRSGLPPYARTGNWVVVLLGCAAAAAGILRRNFLRGLQSI
jgi:apolipoprotein N-acyltransferase